MSSPRGLALKLATVVQPSADVRLPFFLLDIVLYRLYRRLNEFHAMGLSEPYIRGPSGWVGEWVAQASISVAQVKESDRWVQAFK